MTEEKTGLLDESGVRARWVGGREGRMGWLCSRRVRREGSTARASASRSGLAWPTRRMRAVDEAPAQVVALSADTRGDEDEEGDQHTAAK